MSIKNGQFFQIVVTTMVAKAVAGEPS